MADQSMDRRYRFPVLRAVDAATGRQRWSRWLGLGIVIGALSLTRENALLLAVLLAGWAVWPGLGKASAGSLVSGAGTEADT